MPPKLDLKNVAPCAGPSCDVPFATDTDQDESVEIAASEQTNKVQQTSKQRRNRLKKKTAKPPIEIVFNAGPCKFQPIKVLNRSREQLEGGAADPKAHPHPSPLQAPPEASPESGVHTARDPRSISECTAESESNPCESESGSDNEPPRGQV